jgi:hypothetical protein
MYYYLPFSLLTIPVITRQVCADAMKAYAPSNQTLHFPLLGIVCSNEECKSCHSFCAYHCLEDLQATKPFIFPPLVIVCSNEECRSCHSFCAYHCLKDLQSTKPFIFLFLVLFVPTRCVGHVTAFVLTTASRT